LLAAAGGIVWRDISAEYGNMRRKFVEKAGIGDSLEGYLS
jgi:hypothetical protein